MKYLRKIFESKYSNLSYDVISDIEDIFVEVEDINNIGKNRYVWTFGKNERGNWVSVKSRLDSTDESFESIRFDFSGNKVNISGDNFNTIISCTERLKEYLTSHKDVDCNIQIRYRLNSNLDKYDFDEANSKGSFSEISICIFSIN
jgi:hypothetical protein